MKSLVEQKITFQPSSKGSGHPAADAISVVMCSYCVPVGGGRPGRPDGCWQTGCSDTPPTTAGGYGQLVPVAARQGRPATVVCLVVLRGSAVVGGGELWEARGRTSQEVSGTNN